MGAILCFLQGKKVNKPNTEEQLWAKILQMQKQPTSPTSNQRFPAEPWGNGASPTEPIQTTEAKYNQFKLGALLQAQQNQ